MGENHVPIVTTVVVSWNTRELLRSCLASVAAQILEGESEIVVVDNASSDGSPEMVARDFPEVRLLRNEENRGFAQAVNQGMAASKGKYVLLLNSDAVLCTDALQKMLSVFHTYENVGIVGARILNVDGSFQVGFAPFPTLRTEATHLFGWPKVARRLGVHSRKAERELGEREVDWVCGACLMAAREALEQMGGLDEHYFMYSEEVDWCFRMREGGWKVYYAGGAEALHWGGESSKQQSAENLVRLWRSKVLFFEAHRGWVDTEVLRVLIRVVSTMRIVTYYASHAVSRSSSTALPAKVAAARVLLTS